MMSFTICTIGTVFITKGKVVLAYDIKAFGGVTNYTVILQLGTRRA
jgi:hypothetical protein